jgi:hypothetical protein
MLAMTSNAAVAVKSLVSALGLQGGAGLRITAMPRPGDGYEFELTALRGSGRERPGGQGRRCPGLRRSPGLGGARGRAARVTQRLEELLDTPAIAPRRSEGWAWLTAVGLLAVLVTLVLSAPAWSLGSATPAAADDHHACSHTF